MNPLEDIIDIARGRRGRIVLSEGEDPRIVEAAIRAQADRIAHPILLGQASAVAGRVSALGARPEDYEIIDPTTSPSAAAYSDAFYELRKHKDVDREGARKAMAGPLAYAAMMVRLGDAEGTVGGAVHTTADTVRAALQIIGKAREVDTVSSFFLMMLSESHHEKKGGLVFADCGLVVEPTAAELKDIAIASAQSFRRLMKEEPRVAMLSFSTHGSARHDRVSRVVEATDLVRAARPDICIDGELQFDAAFDPAVCAAKAPRSPLKGAANVFIFPSLEAGNIGYKIAQRIGGAKAIGPILQGLSKPANDLSRGCSVDDVYHLIAVTCAQAGAGPSDGRS